MNLLVELLHAWHEFKEVLHSDQFAVKLVMALGQPNLEESCNILEYSKESDEDWVKHVFPKYYLKLVVQYQDSKGVSNQNEHVIVDFLFLLDVFSNKFRRFQRCRTNDFIFVLLHLFYYGCQLLFLFKQLDDRSEHLEIVLNQTEDIFPSLHKIMMRHLLAYDTDIDDPEHIDK